MALAFIRCWLSASKIYLGEHRQALVDQANEALKKNLFPVFVARRSRASSLRFSIGLSASQFQKLCRRVQTKPKDERRCSSSVIRLPKPTPCPRSNWPRKDRASLRQPTRRSNEQWQRHDSWPSRPRRGVRPTQFPALKIDYFDAASAKVWVTMASHHNSRPRKLAAHNFSSQHAGQLWLAICNSREGSVA